MCGESLEIMDAINKNSNTKLFQYGRCVSKKETLSDVIHRDVEDVFSNGTDEEKQDLIKAFYERVFKNKKCRVISSRIVELFGSHTKCRLNMILLVDGIQHELSMHDCRSDYKNFTLRLDKKQISDSQLSELTGIPVSFFEGVSEAMFAMKEFIDEQRQLLCAMAIKNTERNLAELNSIVQESRAAYSKIEFEKQKIKQAKRGLADQLKYKAVDKSIRRRFEKELSRKQLCNGVANASNKFFKLISEGKEVLQMPAVPGPFISRDCLSELPKFSGIYFEWDGDVCVYVGESKDIPQRMKSHQTLSLCSMMSFIEMPIEQLKRSELYYIFMLNPSKNRQLVKL